MKKLFACIVLFVFFLPKSLLCQGHIPSERFAKIEQEIKTWISEGKIPSMAVAVARKGEIVWLDAFGWANKANQVAASPQSIYALGSLSKSIAATGMMTLIEDNKTQLDARVNDLIAPAQLTSYHNSSDEVKVWHILNMSAGIPHGWNTYPDTRFSAFSASDKDQLIDKIGLVTFPPGKYQQYSNYSYGIVDLMMERISGQALEHFLQEAVFQPLRMKNTYSVFQRQRANDFVTLYSGEEEVAPYHFLPYGGGGYYSTAEDLIHYGLFYLKQAKPYQQAILQNSSIDLMHHFPAGAPGMFKIGWFNTGNSLISNGNITGANSTLMLVPEEELAIVCLTNTHRNSYADQMADKILQHILPDFTSAMTREKYASIYEIPYVDNEELLGSWKGKIETYQGPLEVKISCEAEGKIRLKIKQGTWKTLSYPTFNAYQRLEGNFQAHIPFPEKENAEEVFCILNLQYDQGSLYGHIQSNFSKGEEGSFSYGVFLSLKKEQK